MRLLVQIEVYKDLCDFLLLPPILRRCWRLSPCIFVSFDICSVLLGHLIQLDDTVKRKEILNYVLGQEFL